MLVYKRRNGRNEPVKFQSGNNYKTTSLNRAKQISIMRDEGMTAKEIAESLGISVSSVNSYLRK